MEIGMARNGLDMVEAENNDYYYYYCDSYGHYGTVIQQTEREDGGRH